MSERMIPALCQDCLRIVIIETAKHDRGDDRACECGGQVCGCGYCMTTYARLLSGCRDKELLGLDGPDIQFEWSPHDGLKDGSGETANNVEIMVGETIPLDCRVIPLTTAEEEMDLVKQLRQLSSENPSPRDCIDEAADELERLRQLLEGCRKRPSMADGRRRLCACSNGKHRCEKCNWCPEDGAYAPVEW